MSFLWQGSAVGDTAEDRGAVETVHGMAVCMDVSADTSAVTDAAINELLEFVRLEAPEHVEYVNKHVLGKVRNNIQVMSLRAYI